MYQIDAGFIAPSPNRKVRPTPRFGQEVGGGSNDLIYADCAHAIEAAVAGGTPLARRAIQTMV